MRPKHFSCNYKPQPLFRRTLGRLKSDEIIALKNLKNKQKGLPPLLNCPLLSTAETRRMFASPFRSLDCMCDMPVVQ